MYNMTKSIDGEMRFDMVIEHRLSLADLSIYITSKLGHDMRSYKGEIYGGAIREAVKSKKMAVNLAKQELLNRGQEIPFYVVGDDDLDDVREAVEARLKELWGMPT